MPHDDENSVCSVLRSGLVVKLSLQLSAICVALAMLSGCTELRVPLGSFTPATPTVNTLPRYYRRNPEAPEQPKVYGTADVSYHLVQWNDLIPVQTEYLQKGYILLGQCDFAKQTAVPLQQNAIDYARYLGADLVVYSVQQTAEGESEHYINFLARRAAPDRFAAAALDK